MSKCVHCLSSQADSPNDARYVDENGALTCGVCPLKLGIGSWRISDVPDLYHQAIMERVHADLKVRRLETFAVSLLDRLEQCEGYVPSPKNKVIEDWRAGLREMLNDE